MRFGRNLRWDDEGGQFCPISEGSCSYIGHRPKTCMNITESGQSHLLQLTMGRTAKSRRGIQKKRRRLQWTARPWDDRHNIIINSITWWIPNHLHNSRGDDDGGQLRAPLVAVEGAGSDGRYSPNTYIHDKKQINVYRSRTLNSSFVLLQYLRWDEQLSQDSVSKSFVSDG